MKEKLRILTVSSLFGLLALDLLSIAAEAQHVEIILDGSGSMWGETDNGKVKIALAKERLESLITGTGLSQASTIGLITYGHRSKGECNDIERFPSVPYADRSQLLPLIENIQPKGMTPIAGALRTAGDAMKGIEKRAEIVLISDGIEECGDDKRPTALLWQPITTHP